MKNLAKIGVVLVALIAMVSMVNANSIEGFTIYLPLVVSHGDTTPIPQPTPTQVPPTPTQLPPTPTPTVEPPTEDVSVLPNHTSYVSSIDYLHVVGEVQNNTTHNLRFVQIYVNVYNSNGQLLDTGFTFTTLDNLPAGEKTCFHFLTPEPAGWAYYEFEPVSYWTDGDPLPNLTTSNLSSSYNATFGWYEILGQVTNNQGVEVRWVQPVGTLYNASGDVVGCEFTFTNVTDLDPGQTSSFNMLFTGRDYVDVTDFRIQVDGSPQ